MSIIDQVSQLEEPFWSQDLCNNWWRWKVWTPPDPTISFSSSKWLWTSRNPWPCLHAQSSDKIIHWLLNWEIVYQLRPAYFQGSSATHMSVDGIEWVCHRFERPGDREVVRYMDWQGLGPWTTTQHQCPDWFGLATQVSLATDPFHGERVEPQCVCASRLVCDVWLPRTVPGRDMMSFLFITKFPVLPICGFLLPLPPHLWPLRPKPQVMPAEVIKWLGRLLSFFSYGMDCPVWVEHVIHIVVEVILGGLRDHNLARKRQNCCHTARLQYVWCAYFYLGIHMEPLAINLANFYLWQAWRSTVPSEDGRTVSTWFISLSFFAGPGLQLNTVWQLWK